MAFEEVVPKRKFNEKGRKSKGYTGHLDEQIVEGILVVDATTLEANSLEDIETTFEIGEDGRGEDDGERRDPSTSITVVPASPAPRQQAPSIVTTNGDAHTEVPSSRVNEQ